MSPLHPFRRALTRSTAGTSATPAETGGAHEPGPGVPEQSGAGRVPSRRTVGLAAVTTVAVLAGGSIVASAHKTVLLDVDGRTSEVSTFAGSIDGVLEEEGVRLGARDVVAPGGGEALRDGDEVVVRRARLVTVLQDGAEKQVWTTAVDAEEALAGLAGRGDDVRLVASRSAAGRTDLALRLGEGPVDVVVDGGAVRAPEDARTLAGLFSAVGLTTGELDRVQVHHGTVAGAPAPAGATTPAGLTVVVQRVAEQDVTDVTPVPFESTTEQTADIFTGQSRVAVAGVPGERTTVHRVVLVDGVEESRELLSDEVTVAPVTEVVQQGTKMRPPPPPPPAPKPAPARRAAASAGGAASAAAPAPQAAAPAAVGGDVWAALARCESGGNPTIVSRSGTYHGLYQFSVATWKSVGGSGLPSQASPAEQTQRAQALQQRSGWGQWPACSRKLGLR